MSLPNIPAESEIATLPRWAKVAFAARCGRRVLPLFQQFWPDAPEQDTRAVETAVLTAEAGEARSRAAHDASIEAVRAASAARKAPVVRVIAPPARAAEVAEAAVSASFACFNASGGHPFDRSVAKAAVRAAAAGVYATDTDVTAAAIRADFDLLAATARAEKWTDDTPVASGVFGSLWPDRLTASLPESAAATDRLRELMGPYVADVTVEWGFADGPFPVGLQARVTAWNGSRARTIPWHALADDRSVDAVLALLWSGVLGLKISRPSAAG